MALAGIIIRQSQSQGADSRAAQVARIVAAQQYAQQTQQVIKLNVRLSESHQRRAMVSRQTLESGAKVSDHIALDPKSVTLIYEQTNEANGKKTAQEAWEALNKLYQARQPFDLVTEHELYSDMVIESLTGLHQAPMKGAMQFTIVFQQINFAKLSYVKVPASMLARGVQKSASTKIMGGHVEAKFLTADEVVALTTPTKAQQPIAAKVSGDAANMTPQQQAALSGLQSRSWNQSY
jgi:hypothetical protein